MGLLVLAGLLWLVSAYRQMVLHSQYQAVDLKAMGSIAFDDGQGTERDVPQIYRRLDGQKVVIEGEQYADTAAPLVDRFQLIYGIAQHAPHRPPRVQERIFAQALPGQRLPVYAGRALVYGTLHVRAVRDSQNRIMSLYSMTVDAVVPKPPPLNVNGPLVIGLGSLPPGLGMVLIVRRVLRRRQRLRDGLCLKCGYDLRASKERCPECGTSIGQPHDTGTTGD